MSIACCVHLTVRRSEAQTCQAIAPQYETFAASKLVDRYKPGEDFPDNQDDLQSYAIDAARIGIVVLGLGIIMWFCGCCRLCCTCHRLDRNGPCQPWVRVSGSAVRSCRKCGYVCIGIHRALLREILRSWFSLCNVSIATYVVRMVCTRAPRRLNVYRAAICNWIFKFWVFFFRVDCFWCRT